jgi:hypothetical protein
MNRWRQQEGYTTIMRTIHIVGPVEFELSAALRAAGLEYAVAVDSLSGEVWSGRVEQLDQQLTRLANAHSVKAVVTLLTVDHQAAARLPDDPDLAHAIDQAGIVAVAFTDEADAEALADALRQRLAAMGASPLGLKSSIRVVTNSL